LTGLQALRTIGDHLRKRRLGLGLLQREFAERLGVTESTVTNWELNRTTPALRFLPAIIALLGFDPRPAGMRTDTEPVAVEWDGEEPARMVTQALPGASWPDVGTTIARTSRT
jgi:transcriptional regulator with XRE-family HTH domain